ncbi:glutamyl-tRNA amidotransferase subunit a [Niveomyces insectorum RCEF 264]|uniref:Glutamyl-tRNA amidotransferase subunit a n=1 Tax=Niveomyces insectorum RCEF 264 TaxID=1081102 RepID=A0A167N9X6_9HYPO|nr:glutamyl-tRNA amidotransferase subunit a [Niveomyces insectorum RCEF 264]
MASLPFIGYPSPKEAKNLEYTWREDKNPVVRGLSLVTLSALVTNLGFVNRFFWRNTGFGKVKDLPWLDHEVPTLRPRVIPIAPPDATDEVTAAGIVPFGPDILEPRHTAHPDARYYSAADYHALYRSGAATPLDVVTALLPLVQRGRGSPYENAFNTTRVDDLRAAAAASAARWAAGRPRGLLDGVPFSVKADIEVAGYVRTHGMDTRPGDAAFGARYPYLRTPGTSTSWPVQKLLDAGALLVAQNNMHEVGMDTTGCNPSTGTPINWFNKAYYPGGSSSGAGSALGAGLVPLAVGTDAGGSLRIPPAFNSVFGLHPTHDRTVVADNSMGVIGPMAATVADLTATYRTMAQPDPTDAVQGRFAVSRPPSSTTGPGRTTKNENDKGHETPEKRRTIGVPRAWVARADPVVRDHLDRLLAYFRDTLGYDVVDLPLPYLFEGQAAHAITAMNEGIVQARARTAPDHHTWSALLNHQNRIMLSVGQNASAVDYIASGQLRTVLMRHLAHVFRTQYADRDLVIVTPTTPCVGWPVTPGDEAYGMLDGNKSLECMRHTWLANTTGCPSLSAPMGYADPVQGEGVVPLGAMAMGEWGSEELLLAWAADVETYLHEVYAGGRRRPDMWVDVIGLAKEEAKAAAAAAEADQ